MGSTTHTCPTCTPVVFASLPELSTVVMTIAPVHEAAANAPLRKVSTTGAAEATPRIKRRRRPSRFPDTSVAFVRSIGLSLFITDSPICSRVSRDSAPNRGTGAANRQRACELSVESVDSRAHLPQPTIISLGRKPYLCRQIVHTLQVQGPRESAHQHLGIQIPCKIRTPIENILIINELCNSLQRRIV